MAGAHYGSHVELDSADHRGWFLGHFVPSARADGLLTSDAVEVKWGVHRAGEERHAWAPGEDVHTMSVLVAGDFVTAFRDREYRLRRPGDFVVWGPGVEHTWRAEADSTVLTVRWPSRPPA